MNEAEWRWFLHNFSRVLLQLDADQDEFSEQDYQLGYVKCIGADEEEIVAAENRLGIQLPISYRSFLKVSDGWPYKRGGGSPGKLLPIMAIQWFRIQEPRWLEILTQPNLYQSEDLPPEEHLYYRDIRRDECFYRQAYLPGTLAISETENSEILLLCPEVIDENGEWECWHLWKSGADRYHSFLEWMYADCSFSLNLLNEKEQ